MKQAFVVILIVFLFGSLKAQKDSAIYSFFTAGHTYGSPNNPHYGLHFPFVDYIPIINNYPNMNMGFLTGDVVVHSTPDYWDSAMIDINKFNMSIFIAAGNHDMGDEFLNRFQYYYYSFTYNDDLFIILTPGLDSWNISGDQLEFLNNTLDSNYSDVNNIFIFMHELVWWSPINEYQNVIINYAPYYPGSTNFDGVIKPLLLSYPNRITIYAGDLGCTTAVSPYMYNTFDNVTLIASGMGGGVKDNIIITTIYEDSVYYDLVAINGDNPKALGELTDFSLTSIPERKTDSEVLVYPNPCINHFNVVNKFQYELKLSIYNSYGKMVQSTLVFKHSEKTIERNNLIPGIYFLLFEGDKVYFWKKIIVQ